MNTEEAKKLLLGKWEKIVLQGGKFFENIEESKYLLGSICIYVNKQWVEISACSEDYLSKDGYWEEDFFLYVSILDIPPVPEPSKMNNPPRKIITEFPSDCRLDYLTDYGVKNVDLSFLKEKDELFIIKQKILLHSHNGFKFSLETSEILLESIEISMIT